MLHHGSQVEVPLVLCLLLLVLGLDLGKDGKALGDIFICFNEAALVRCTCVQSLEFIHLWRVEVSVHLTHATVLMTEHALLSVVADLTMVEGPAVLALKYVSITDNSRDS